MKILMRYLFAAFLAVGVLLAGCPTSEAFSFSKIDAEGVLLVLPMQNKTEAVALGDYLGNAETTFVDELQSSGVFAHVRSMSTERKRLDELAFQKNGLTQNEVKDIADTVKARYVLYSSLTGLSVKRSKGNVIIANSGGVSDAGGGASEKVSARITVHIIDRETGETVFYGSGAGASSTFKMTSNVAVPIRVGAEAAPEEECNNAIYKAIQNVSYEKEEGMADTLQGKG